MANTRTAHTEAAEPGAAANSRHVHGAVPNRILPGTEAVHHMQHRVPGGRVPHMLQRLRQLHILQQQLRLCTVRQRLTDGRKTGAREQPVVHGLGSGGRATTSFRRLHYTQRNIRIHH